MNARLMCAVALAGLYVAAPLNAYAADYHVIYDAVITDGFDNDNIFGLAGQSLAGLGLRADLTYSTSVGGVRTTTATSDRLVGGDAFGTAPVISSAVFTVGSSSFSFVPTYYGEVFTGAGSLSADGYDLFGNNFQTSITPTSAGPANLQTRFVSTGSGDTGGATTQGSYLISGNDDIDFDPLDVLSAVPEPATWAMMLVGFGAMGCALRQRKDVRTVVSFA